MKKSIVLFFVILTSCCFESNPKFLSSGIIEKRNPITYRFNSNYSEVKSAITDYTKWVSIFEPPNDDVMKDGSVLFRLLSKKEDSLKKTLAIYHGYCGGWIGKSSFYFSDSGYLDFQGKFRLTVQEIDSTSTDVSVQISDMSVMYGWAFNLHGGGCKYNFVFVKPTGIEEYKFLLYLGKKLNEKNMPNIVLPNTNINVNYKVLEVDYRNILYRLP
ncbi:MAG: hypothetical protein KAH48_12565 [Chlorobi bacterium]|nr:hypothetical protein [Chlorobiota bacterium]